METSYPIEYAGYNINFLAGGTLFKGFYANKVSLVNIGACLGKNIQITQDYSIPFSLGFYTNPNSRYAYGIVCLTL